MTAEEELIQLRQEKQLLQEQLAQREELIVQMQQQLAALTEQVQTLQERLKKNSHNSHLPPSSDRFVRQPKSLRKPSGKKAGGQAGHQGTTLPLKETPDEVIVHAVEVCAVLYPLLATLLTNDPLVTGVNACLLKRVRKT